MITEDLVPATLLPRELEELNQTGSPVPSYHRLWNLMVGNRIPAERLHNGRWVVRREHLPVIARQLGLTRAQVEFSEDRGEQVANAA